MTDRVSFSILPGAVSQQVTALTGTSVQSLEVFPAVANPMSPAFRRDGKALVSITGGGANWQSFNMVYIARGTNPTANAGGLGLIAGNTYVIEGINSGDKLAFLSVGTNCTVSITPVA